jgi:metallophosphoesterase (TIGR00282 family)
MRILFIGEIVGKSGIQSLKTLLPAIKEEFSVNFCVAGANAVTGGFGLGKNHALYLRKLGVNLLMGADAIYFKKDLVSELSSFNFILRPANLPPKAAGRGFAVYTINNKKIGFVNMLGLSGYTRMHATNPFTYMLDLLENRLKDNFINILCFNALTTAEKQTMGHLLRGRAAAVIGYGARALTADAFTADGTAYITDCGRTGSRHSVAGLNHHEEIDKMISQRPLRSREGWQQLELSGILVEIDDESGRAVAVETIRRSCPQAESADIS